MRPALFGVCHIFCTAGEGAICPFFTALTELLLRWLAALRGRGTLKPNGPCVPLSEGDLILGVYEFETLRQYVGFVDQCAQNALQDERTSTAVHLAVMGFFEQVRVLRSASGGFGLLPSASGCFRVPSSATECLPNTVTCGATSKGRPNLLLTQLIHTRPRA